MLNNVKKFDVMRIISKFALKVKDNEVNTKPSKVEISDCPSVEEMLRRFSQGYPIDSSIKYHEGDYYRNEDINHLDNPEVDPDLTDLERASKHLQNLYDEANKPEEKPPKPSAPLTIVPIPNKSSFLLELKLSKYLIIIFFIKKIKVSVGVI